MASLRHTIGELGTPAKLALGALVATVGGGGVYFLSTYEVPCCCMSAKDALSIMQPCTYLAQQPTCLLNMLLVLSCHWQMGPPHTVSQCSRQDRCCAFAKDAHMGEWHPMDID
jgi:hypothetical protein